MFAIVLDQRGLPYHFLPAKLVLDAGKEKAEMEWAFSTWTAPIDLQLGSLYLDPDVKQFVRMNLGISQLSLKTTEKVEKVRLEVVGRAKKDVLKTVEVDATPSALLAQRAKIPVDLRGDLSNLLLADLDVSFLPVQPFANPDRKWFIRATALAAKGKTMWSVDSPFFCRLGHDVPQPPIGKVTIDNEMMLVNGQPWMPWGVTYGHNPVYAGPADPGAGKYRDLSSLPEWNIYDRHGGSSTSREALRFQLPAVCRRLGDAAERG